MKIESIKRTERGWPGHFICAAECRFRRNTLLEKGRFKVVVSTVGSYIRGGKPEEIGLNRHYETMAFRAVKEGSYWDADVSESVDFDAPRSIHCKKNSDWDGVDNRANEMHEKVVDEISHKMESNHYLTQRLKGVS